MDSKSPFCMANNGKYTKHTRKISRIVHLVRNGENWKNAQGGLQLADIVTKNVGEHDWTPRMKYFMLRIDNWDRILVKKGWNNTG